MTTQSAARFDTIHTGIEAFREFLGPWPKWLSKDGLQTLSAMFVDPALEDLETATKELAKRELPFQGKHVLRQHMQSHDGCNDSSWEGVDIDPSNIRLLINSAENARRRDIVMAFARVPAVALAQIEVREYTHLLGEEPFTTAHFTIAFANNKIVSVQWGCNARFEPE